MYDAFLNGLNDQQKEAVLSTEGYIRVIAGAGSGKTRALTHRYAHLVRQLGISERNILCVTFTNKAANEMKNRLRTMLGDLGNSFICTFHAFCAQLIREDSGVVNFPRNFCIFDEEDRRFLVKQTFDELAIDPKELTIKSALEAISLTKGGLSYIPLLVDPSFSIIEQEKAKAESLIRKVFVHYCYLQRKSFGLDFQDLINIALYILQNSERVCKRWQEQFQYIMVDEFQDVNAKQYQLCKVLSSHHHNLFVVGDPDQTIYSFRGARMDYILNFPNDYSDAKTIMMTQNYRSASRILSASNSLIAKNTNRIKKDLIPLETLGKGSSVYFHAKNRPDESKWVVEQILRLIEHGISYSDIAVLYRTHRVSLFFEEAFMQNKLPYTIYSGTEFYERSEIKTAISYMRMVVVGDDISFMRTINNPPRGIGKKRLEYLKGLSEQNNETLYKTLVASREQPLFQKTGALRYIDLIEKYRLLSSTIKLTDFVQGLLDESGYEEYLRRADEEERLDNLAELKQSVVRYETEANEETCIEDYLNTVSLYTNTESKSATSSIKMMTIHTAKGMEFDYVFIVGFNEGVLPSRKARDRHDIEEERRIAYVAYTRAKKELFISDAEDEKEHGTGLSYPSRFLFNTEEHNLDYVVPLTDELKKGAIRFVEKWEQEHQEYNVNPVVMVEVSKFKEGQRVYHPFHKEGTVLKDDTDAKCLVIKFDQYRTNRNLGYPACAYLNIISSCSEKNNASQVQTETSADIKLEKEVDAVSIATKVNYVDEQKSPPDLSDKSLSPEPLMQEAARKESIISNAIETKVQPNKAGEISSSQHEHSTPFAEIPPKKLPYFPAIIGFVALLLISHVNESILLFSIALIFLLSIPVVYFVNKGRENKYVKAKIAHENQIQHQGRK